MRDPTRGGLATVAHEMPRATGSDVRLRQGDIPVRDAVQSVCEMLGYDPMYPACEGRVVAVVSPPDADEALRRWRALPDGAGRPRWWVRPHRARGTWSWSRSWAESGSWRSWRTTACRGSAEATVT